MKKKNTGGFLKNPGIKQWIAVVSFALLLSASSGGDKEVKESTGRVPAAAEEANPIKVGSRLPELTLTMEDGDSFDLNAAIAEKQAVLVFYRGRW